MSVNVTLAGGIPLGRSLVTCNATQGLSLNSPVLSLNSGNASNQMVAQLAQQLITGQSIDISSLIATDVDISKLKSGNIDVSNLPSCNLGISLKNISSLNLTGLVKLAGTYNMTFSNEGNPNISIANMSPDEMQKLICYLKNPPSTANTNYLPYLIQAQNQITLAELSQGNLGVEDLGNLLERSNVILDANRTQAYTDDNGIAEFQLRFIAGSPGNYSIVFQAGSVVSKASTPILLTNKIQYVVYVNNLAQTIAYPFATDESFSYVPAYVNFTISPVISLRQADGSNFTGNVNNIQFHLMLSSDIVNALTILNSSADDTSWVDIQNVNTMSETLSNPVQILSKQLKLIF